MLFRLVFASKLLPAALRVQITPWLYEQHTQRRRGHCLQKCAIVQCTRTHPDYLRLRLVAVIRNESAREGANHAYVLSKNF